MSTVHPDSFAGIIQRHDAKDMAKLYADRRYQCGDDLRRKVDVECRRLRLDADERAEVLHCFGC